MSAESTISETFLLFVKTIWGGLPILCMRSMKPKAYSLSWFDSNGTITQYIVKQRLYIILPSHNSDYVNVLLFKSILYLW